MDTRKNCGDIPKKIHQIYFGQEMPDRLLVNVRELRDLNPGWTHTLYDAALAEKYIAKHFDHRIQRAYSLIDNRYYAARADLLRYLIVYREGGVYLDIKSRFEGPIETFIRGDEGFILSHWRNEASDVHAGFGLHPDLSGIPRGEFQNFHVIAAPGHPFLKAVIDRVVHNIERYAPWSAVGRTGVLRTTGPIAYTKAILPLIEQHPHTLVRHEGAIGLQYSIPDAYSESSVVHYSKVTVPVVRLSRVGEMASSVFFKLRELKNRRPRKPSR